jgi:4-amino-4-deoxy-L-arabinose transferase-like glycosyltransferase
MSGRLVTPLAALVLFVSALSTAAVVPLFDPDEGYYPATAAESVDGGAWWDLRLNGEARWEKPVLAYALIEASFAAFGRGPVAARLPSALQGAALVLLAGVLVSRFAGRRAGGATAVVLASTLGVQVFARASHPEIALVLSMAVTELLLTIWLVSPAAARSRGLPALIGLSMGYGLLAKGPVAIVVPLLGIACAAPFVTRVSSRWREAVRDAALAGLVALVIAAPWYAAMTWRHGLAFLRDGVWAQNFGRYTGQIEHGQSAITFVLAAAAGLMPWTGLLPASLKGLRRPADDPRAAARFTIAVVTAVSLAFYALSASKLASYSLALIPPSAVLVGLYLDDVFARIRQPDMAFIGSGLLLGAVAIALLAVPQLHGTAFQTRELIGGVPSAQAGSAMWPLVTPVAIVLLVGGVCVFALPRARVAVLAAVGVAAPLAILLAASPLLNDAYPWERFGRQIAAEPGPAWVQNYRAPSLTFYAGRPVERVGGDEALADLVRDAQGGWVVLGADWEAKPPLADRLRAGRATIVDRTPRLALVRLR